MAVAGEDPSHRLRFAANRQNSSSSSSKFIKFSIHKNKHASVIQNHQVCQNWSNSPPTKTNIQASFGIIKFVQIDQILHPQKQTFKRHSELSKLVKFSFRIIKFVKIDQILHPQKQTFKRHSESSSLSKLIKFSTHKNKHSSVIQNHQVHQNWSNSLPTKQTFMRHSEETQT